VTTRSAVAVAKSGAHKLDYLFDGEAMGGHDRCLRCTS
jgi:hypothetical protein